MLKAPQWQARPFVSPTTAKFTILTWSMSSRATTVPAILARGAPVQYSKACIAPTAHSDRSCICEHAGAAGTHGFRQPSDSGCGGGLNFWAAGAISIIDADVNVDFDAPADYEEPVYRPAPPVLRTFRSPLPAVPAAVRNNTLNTLSD